MTSKYHNLSATQLKDKLTSLLSDTHNNLYEICCILMLQYDRGHLDPAMRVGVFKWFPQIARGELDPMTALTLDGMDARIRAMVGLPLVEQKRLAKGGTVVVATLGKDGKIVTDDRAIYQLSARDFEMVFDAGKVRAFNAQKAILAARTKPKPSTAHRSSVPLDIRVDVSAEEVIVGQMRIKASELIEALAKLGFTCRRLKPKGL